MRPTRHTNVLSRSLGCHGLGLEWFVSRPPRAAQEVALGSVAAGRGMSVLALVRASDDRLWGHLLDWRPPRWFCVWMLAASRLADGWLYPLVALLLAARGRAGLAVLAAGAVAALVANSLLFLAKGRFRRMRPCEQARPIAFDVTPLGWFALDRFSFPSGHALNSFAVGTVVALAFPLAAVPVVALAASIAASRVVLGLHWLSDVLVGALTGAVIGCGVFVALLR